MGKLCEAIEEIKFFAEMLKGIRIFHQPFSRGKQGTLWTIARFVLYEAQLLVLSSSIAFRQAEASGSFCSSAAHFAF